MKINILDAGIRYRAGHHFDHNLRLFKHLVEAGHDVHVYGFSGMDADVEGEFSAVGPLTKLFKTFQYPSEPYDWYADEIVRYHKESAAFARDLRAVREADLWIWTTIEAHHLNACAARRPKAQVVGCVYWEPGVEAGSIAAMLWRDALLAARHNKLRFTLASVESEMRHRFKPIMGPSTFVVLPQPVDGPPIAEPKNALKRIGFFGHQRNEKGAELMSDLLKMLSADGYAITLQNSNPDFEVSGMPGVELLDYVDDLAEPIARCDLVVLPYEVQKYRARGSGILVECLAVGVPVSAPIGTLPGRIVEQYRVGPLFGSTRTDSIYHAIKSADANYATYADNAFRAAREFGKRNGVAQFASALLSVGANIRANRTKSPS